MAQVTTFELLNDFPRNVLAPWDAYTSTQGSWPGGGSWLRGENARHYEKSEMSRW